MRIMLTGFSLSMRAGHHPASRRLARVLQARGHVVMASGSHPLQLPRTVEIDSIPVVSDPCRLVERPDIIHACHPHDAFWALSALPGVPAVLEAGERPYPVTSHPRIYRRLFTKGSPTTDPAPSTRSLGQPSLPMAVTLPSDEESLGEALEDIYTQVVEENRNRAPDPVAEAAATLEYLKVLFWELARVPELNPLSF
jgi:hypothetical protein